MSDQPTDSADPDQPPATQSGADTTRRLPHHVRAHANECQAGGLDAREAVAELTFDEALERHDQYTSWHAAYPFRPLIRAHLWRLANNWPSQPRLHRALKANRVFLAAIGFERVPDQSTLWRAWIKRFTPGLRSAIEAAAAALADVYPFPGPPGTHNEASREGDGRLTVPVDDETEPIIEQAQRLVYPELDLDRHHNTAIPDRAFWAFQAYMGTHEDLCANGASPLFAHDTDRNVTPSGHTHRTHIRNLETDGARENYQRAVTSIVEAAKSTGRFDRSVTVAVDITTSRPFTGDSEAADGLIGTKEATDEYAYHSATIQIVDTDPTLVLDAHPVQPGEEKHTIVERLLDTARKHVAIELVLLDREFDSEGVKTA